MTGHPGIFAGGDMVPAERTVTVAIGHGKKAARAIDTCLRGSGDDAAPRHDLAAYDKLNTWYYADAPATMRPKLEAARRTGTFDEVTGGLDASTALFEARRCMSCGNCFDCDNCYGRLPGQRGHQDRPWRLRDRLRLLQGLRHLRRRMPLRVDRHGPRGNLSARGNLS
jgi:hypothetical protein